MSTKRTAAFLMANLGSEVSRLYAWKNKGDIDSARACYERAKKILARVEQNIEMQSRKQELLILGNVIDDVLRKKPKYTVSEIQLKDYFLPIAVSFAMRMNSSGK